jgi:phosphate:Na+ symporter
VAAADAQWRCDAAALLRAAEPPAEPEALPGIDGMLAAVEGRYQALKDTLLVAGAEARLPLAAMDLRLHEASALRRALQQSVKAAHRDADIAADLSAAA